MIIRAYEKIGYPSRISVLEKDLRAAGELTLTGYYEELDDVFYLFHGSYEIEAAHRIDLPLTLIACDMDDILHHSEIDFDSMLQNDMGGPVFNSRGRASVLSIIEAIPGFSGEDYYAEDFSQLQIIPYSQYRKSK